MIVIKELKVGVESVYRYIIDHTKVLRDIKLATVRVVNDDGKVFLVLYDSNKRVVRDVYRYINYEMGKQSYNSKSQSIQALKLLFSYCELFDLNYRDFDLEEARKFKSFLFGDTRIGSYVTLDMLSRRGNDTINSYLGVYRLFYEYMGIKDSPFHQKKLSKCSAVGISDKSDSGRYVLMERKQQSERNIPRYIKPKEFTRIIQNIREQFKLRDELIVRLMFECGMRIGEVLGLTLEDIISDSKGLRNNFGGEFGTIIIRNRVSNQRYQLAKSCLKPNRKSEYKKKSYKTENVGYQVVHPSSTLIAKLEEYIEAEHGYMSSRNRENYLIKSKADSVENTELLEGENYYVFLNKNATPLSISGWNKNLRQIFNVSGLSIDREIRKHNLNHRFRHGYAMFLKKYMKANELDLMYALRHRSPNSVRAYFRPDEEDVYKANEEALISMMDVCPLLRS